MPDTKHVKLGFRTVGYSERSLSETLRSLSDIGYDGVEMCLEHPDARPESLSPRRAEEIARIASDVGLQVAAVSYHGDFEPPDQRAENQTLAVNLTRSFGTNVLILNAQAARAGHERQQWDEFRGALGILLSHAETQEVFVALEPEPGHYLHSSDDMARLIEQMRHPNLKVNLDVGHAFLTDDDVTDSIQTLSDSIVHTHFEGMPAREHAHLVPGEGDLDLGAVHHALLHIGYAGYYTVDLFRISDDPDGYAKRSLAGMREIIGH